jgi:hypothetical protein
MLSLAEIAEKLGGKVMHGPKGDYVQAPGPGHSKKDASLSVKLTDDGKDVLVNTFAGDDRMEALKYVRDMLGLKGEPKKGSNGKANGKGKANGNGKLDNTTMQFISEHVYVTAEGKPYGLVKKYVDDQGKKHFFQYHWDEATQSWPTGKPKGPKVPYMLPELIKAHSSSRIFFCEGEKDADALHAKSFVATTMTEGAGKPWDPAMTRYFKDRTVVILADADAKALRPVAKSVKVLDLYEDRDDGSDISDFLKHDAAGVQLVKRADKTPEWDPGEAKKQEQEQLDEIARLKGLDQVLKKKELAKELGITGKELDKVLQEKDASKQPEHWTVEPWAEPVLTEALLNQLEEIYIKHVILPEHGAVVMALWCLHSWAIDAASATAFLHFISPVPECGKTRAMEVMQWTVSRGFMASNMSPSVLYRLIDRDHPTLIIDEAETYIKREDVRGILDGSHTRAGARTIRNIGDNHEPAWFETFGPKIIGGLGKLQKTIQSRCITLHMKRKKKTEKVIKLRGYDTDAFKALRSQACRWRDDNIEALKKAQPMLPSGLTDRGEDCWEPLFAIAELAGAGWVTKAHAAARALNGSHDVGDDDLGVQLLAKMRDLFEITRETSSADGVTSQALMEYLHKDTTGPWLAYGKMQKEITQRQIADLLRPFDIKPRTIRDGSETDKGYKFAWFTDAFDTYLVNPPIQSVTPSQVNDNKHLAQFSSVTPDQVVTDEKADKSLISLTCDGVTDQKQGGPPVCRYCTDPVDGSEVSCTVAGITVHLHEKCVDAWLDAAKTMTPEEMLQTYR